MRLGFGVAAFLEPDVLLVDEVLAVGDATFQQRCLDQMRKTLNGGTTLVFVSHDLAAIDAMCKEGVWLNDGEIRARGAVRDVLAAYRRAVEADAEVEPRASGLIDVSVAVAPARGSIVRTNEALDVVLTVDTEQDRDGWFYIGFSEGTASPIFVVTRFARVTSRSEQASRLDRASPLATGPLLDLAREPPSVACPRSVDELSTGSPSHSFDVYGPQPDEPPLAVVRLAPIFVDADWSIENP